MRQGIGCVLHEARAGSLDELRRCLEGWRFVCRVASPGFGSAGQATPTGTGELILAEVRSDWPTGAAAAVAAHRLAGGPRLALCPGDDAKALSVAASLGFDDIVAMPLDPVELVRRLQALANLAELAAERQRRIELFAAYRSQAAPPAPSAGPDAARRPAVALLGKADENQVQAAAALPTAALTYLEGVAGLAAVLQGGGVDVLLVTEPALLAAALQAVDTVGCCPPVLVAAHAGPPWALELPPQIDLLSLPAPMPLVRTRLALALRVAGLRKWLREPPLGEARGLLVDSLTGLYNQGAFFDYLRAAGEGRAVIGLEHDRLDAINQASGYAAGNRVLAQLGASLRRRTRAHDFAAHLGGGRFAVAVAATDRAKVERLRCRLQSSVAEAEPWLVLASAEPMPVRGTPAQRVSRLFADLRRLRPAA